ncbi:piggyBac transposable element-derived protein 4-like [Teleopsis dalmanni]|uniref:piggyBac transposable element-derived protein 4-like n=1 Tax=Teleopsis dalmanni TaxID=139649 RepID=UPI0018CDA47F|nr:piggyBac transposable element-derived protein 4-like [Teleopsis dalmanni]
MFTLFVAAYLTNLDECSSTENESEIEDVVLEDDIQSDAEDEDLNVQENRENVSPDPEHEETKNNSSSLGSRIVRVLQPTLRSKSQYCWTTSKGRNAGRVLSMNVVRAIRGPTRACKVLCDPISSFNAFFTDEIISEIVQWTNAEISLTRTTNLTGKTFADTNCLEIRALLGILNLTAVLKDNHLKVWDLLIKQCNDSYTPESYNTIDEQLLAFRGRCPFKMYIPSKPNKYGIKIVMICDSATKYMFNAIPYLGKTTTTSTMPLGEYFVKELTRPIHGTCRNITCDNWFTSVQLAKSLLKEPYKLTIVGTIRSNKREIPEQMKNSRSRPVGTTMFCFDGPLTLASYKPKPSKMVYLLSSCNEPGTINQTSGKPDIILHYNQTKGGVDTFDQMCSLMSCSRKTNRWPMAVFYGMLNISFINSYVIYCHNMISTNKKPLNRKEFMKVLSMSLTMPWMEQRQEIPILSKSLRCSNTATMPTEAPNHDSNSSEEPSSSKKRKYCAFCPSKIRRMSKMKCFKCEKSG